MAKGTAEEGRAAWEALHSMWPMTPESIRQWIETVPNYECACKDFAQIYINANPPPYDGTREQQLLWSWKFHDIVDEKKTGDDRMSWEDARAQWL